MMLNEITIEITQQCPNQCVHCSSLSCLSKTTRLSLPNVFEMIDDALSLGCKSISVSGGEPFLHPDLMDIIRYIHKNGAKCVVYTSGITIEGGKPVSVPRHLLGIIHGMVEKYVVNVEAADEETYDQIMGTSFHGFNMVKQFISDAVSMGENVEAHTVPMKLNYRQIPDIVNMCNSLGVSRVSFLRFVPQGRGLSNIHNLLLNENEMKEARLLMSECVANSNVGIRLGIPFSDCSNRTDCQTGTEKLVVRYDGNVYPCEAFKNEFSCNMIHSMPDNVKHNKLRDIYTDSAFLQEVREANKVFQCLNTCETCVNQYFRNQLLISDEEIDR